MATSADLQSDVSTLLAAVQSLKPKLDTVVTLVSDLKAQVAAGQLITQADLDTLDATVKEAQAALADETTEVEGIS